MNNVGNNGVEGSRGNGNGGVDDGRARGGMGGW
ncbi:hypothetical protein HRbin04_00744 [archaeon HR04]|nr:hypothetical protein HRbin04_00744 [archaeon HR04]